MKINTGQSVKTRLETNKNTPRKEVTINEEIQGKDKAILNVKFGKDKDEVFLMGKHLNFIKDIDNAAGFTGLAASAAVAAVPVLLDMGPTGRAIGGVIGATMAMSSLIYLPSVSSHMLQNQSLLSDKACKRHHGLTISAFGVMGAAIGTTAGGLGGIVVAGIGGLVAGMVAASQQGWPEPN